MLSQFFFSPHSYSSSNYHFVANSSFLCPICTASCRCTGCRGRYRTIDRNGHQKWRSKDLTKRTRPLPLNRVNLKRSCSEVRYKSKEDTDTDIDADEEEEEEEVVPTKRMVPVLLPEEDDEDEEEDEMAIIFEEPETEEEWNAFERQETLDSTNRRQEEEEVAPRPTEISAVQLGKRKMKFRDHVLPSISESEKSGEEAHQTRGASRRASWGGVSNVLDSASESTLEASQKRKGTGARKSSTSSRLPKSRQRKNRHSTRDFDSTTATPESTRRGTTTILSFDDSDDYDSSSDSYSSGSSDNETSTFVGRPGWEATAQPVLRAEGRGKGRLVIWHEGPSRKKRRTGAEATTSPAVLLSHEGPPKFVSLSNISPPPVTFESDE